MVHQPLQIAPFPPHPKGKTLAKPPLGIAPHQDTIALSQDYRIIPEWDHLQEDADRPLHLSRHICRLIRPSPAGRLHWLLRTPPAIEYSNHCIDLSRSKIIGFTQIAFGDILRSSS